MAQKYQKRGASVRIQSYVKSRELQGPQSDGRCATLAEVNPLVFGDALPGASWYALDQRWVDRFEKNADRMLVWWIRHHAVDHLLPCRFYMLLKPAGSFVKYDGPSTKPKKCPYGVRPLACIYAERSFTGELRITHETLSERLEKGLL